MQSGLEEPYYARKSYFIHTVLKSGQKISAANNVIILILDIITREKKLSI